MLDRSAYLIKEHVGLLKLSNTYDIFDANTQEQLGVAQEKPGLWIHLLRLVVNQGMLPTQVFVYKGSNTEDPSALLFSLHKGAALFRPKVDIRNGAGESIGFLKRQKLISFTSFFDIFDPQEKQVASLKGDWAGWDFRILDQQGQEMGRITKKWGGLAKEFFTSADQYVVELPGSPDAGSALLLLAAGIAVDTVYKEKK